MTRQSFQRLTTSLVVVAALSLGSAVSAHATTIIVKYALSGGTQTGAIKVPPNTPVLMMGNQTRVGDIGVAQLVVQNIPAEGLQWSGSSSWDGNAINSWDPSDGTYIASLDFDGDVSLLVQFIPNKKGTGGNYGFIIKNTSGSTLTGQVKLIY